jgi:hypothetical protein
MQAMMSRKWAMQPTITISVSGWLTWPVRTRDQNCPAPAWKRWVTNKLRQFQAAGMMTPTPNPHGLFRSTSTRTATYIRAWNKCKRASWGTKTAESVRAKMKSPTPIEIDTRIQEETHTGEETRTGATRTEATLTEATLTGFGLIPLLTNKPAARFQRVPKQLRHGGLKSAFGMTRAWRRT